MKGTLLGDAKPPERAIFDEAQATQRWTGPLRREAWNPPLFAVYLGNDKFIVHRPAEGIASPMQRFDLASDPAEQNPLIVDDALAKQIGALVARHSHATARGPALEGGDDPGESEDLLRRLRALGYAE
jgi:hypothetical protein